MNPEPLILQSVACAVLPAAVWVMWTSKTNGFVLVRGGLAGAASAFLIAPYVFACFVLCRGHANDLKWFVENVLTNGTALGMFSAIPGFFFGMIGGAIGRVISLHSFPEGSDRRPDESLATYSKRIGGTMTLKKALLVIIGLTVMGGALGCLGGYLLGTYNPAYYRGVFGGGHRPEFDPVAVGIGLGLSQWAAGGLVVGTILVVVLTWYDLRCRRIAADAARPASREELTGSCDTRVMREAPRPG